MGSLESFSSYHSFAPLRDSDFTAAPCWDCGALDDLKHRQREAADCSVQLPRARSRVRRGDATFITGGPALPLLARDALFGCLASGNAAALFTEGWRPDGHGLARDRPAEVAAVAAPRPLRSRKLPMSDREPASGYPQMPRRAIDVRIVARGSIGVRVLSLPSWPEQAARRRADRPGVVVRLTRLAERNLAD